MMSDLATGHPELRALIEDEISRTGPVTLARFMELALYHPEFGYYLQATRHPGRGGDFITSPEISPYFGLTVARQVVECWKRLGQPASWVVREFGSGIGGLAYDILAGVSRESAEAYQGLVYEAIEINPFHRESIQHAMAEAKLDHKVNVARSSDELATIEGVVLANEVADAMPAHRLVRLTDGWQEAHVTSEDGEFGWVMAHPNPVALSALQQIEMEGNDLEEGAVLDLSPAAADWFRHIGQGIDRGYALVIDYGYEADMLFSDHRLQGTLRGYSGHTVTDDPFIRVGEQDLTIHVDFTALRKAGEEAGFVGAGITTQGAFLSSLGMGEFLLDLQKDPETDVETYLGSQAVVLRLIDPGGLGRFSVMMMARNAPVEPPLLGFSVAPPAF